MADYDFVTAVDLSGTATANDNAGVGTRFTNTTGTSIIITQLGRWVVSGNSQTHQVGIYTTNNTSSLAASVTVNTSGATPSTFIYGTLSSPYTLTSGSTIYIISLENIGGDAFVGVNTSYPGLTTPSIGTTSSAALSGTTINVFGNTGHTYTAFGPVTFRFSSPAIPGWTKTGTTYDCLAYQYAVSSAAADASPGDTINLPVSGSATWGANVSYVYLGNAVTLNGRGTTITVDPTAGTYSNPGVILNAGGATIKNLVFTQTGSANTSAITCITNRNWRVTGCTYNGSAAGAEGYFVYWTSYGLIDNCTLTTPWGQSEPFFGRGPSNSWTSANSLGTADATYIEDCTWNGAGYTDFNANARAVIRFCTFNETDKKVDAHGYWTNSPPYGVRQTECYYNTFTTGTGSNYSAIEIRGGLYYGFFNTTSNANAAYVLHDYGYEANSGNWGIYQTPLNYPLWNQIGTGQFVSVSASTLVAYQRCEIIDTGSGSTNYMLIGAPDNNPGTQFTATGPATGTGHAYICPATEPSYSFGNTQLGGQWPINNAVPAAGAITLYQTQTSNPSATFTGADIIKPNANVFADAGAQAVTGVVVGLFASMGSASGLTNHGYWATDRGSWRAGHANSSGQLYVSNGTSWVLSYTPYTYPHPLQTGIPVLASAAIPTTGATLSLTFSESCTSGAGGSAGVTITASGGAATATYSSGSGSVTYVYTLSRTIQAGETVTVSYTQPGNGIESTAAQVDVATFSGSSVTNNSVQGAGGTTINVTTLNVTTLTLG